MSEYDRRGPSHPSADLLARLSLALRAVLEGEREESTLVPLTREFCRASREAGIPPEGVVQAFKQALGATPSRPYEGRFTRLREQLITQCIASYYAPSNDVPERPALVPEAQRQSAVVVDDDPVIVALLEFILAPAFDVRSFDDARRALADFYERRPALVVLDVHLPDYSGGTLLAVLRTDPRLRSVPAIAVTGDDDPQLEQKLRAEGFGDFFRKPLVDPDAILAAAIRLAGLPAGVAGVNRAT